jgi:hypothetical protein
MQRTIIFILAFIAIMQSVTASDSLIWKGSIHREQFHLTNEVSTHREHF